MNILSWILFGLLTGIIANLIDPHPTRGGVFGTLALGIVGAMVGGFLGSTIVGVGINGFNLPSLAVAVLGSLLLLFIYRAVTKA